MHVAQHGLYRPSTCTRHDCCSALYFGPRLRCHRRVRSALQSAVNCNMAPVTWVWLLLACCKVAHTHCLCSSFVTCQPLSQVFYMGFAPHMVDCTLLLSELLTADSQTRVSVHMGLALAAAYHMSDLWSMAHLWNTATFQSISNRNMVAANNAWAGAVSVAASTHSCEGPRA